ncbi:GNAT family N-acetyltransferase [Tissierella sp. MB52-C2]|uniref:aminoglycoside 6'-N-acetyltransferase n=1 Tax=Tissierella sp. MB52-C2 TaxID=3070999 RepID=UPI00280C0831|nr:aminoglycoside 6'-N-acetyltransferase [Tissierella sp. MB52-C2]WMM24734.1 GNAT family N-acetyltransferase [Tissierella sp. MB52-C2]
MIKQASVEDCKIVSELAILLWEDNEINSLEEDFLSYINLNKGAIFLYFDNMEPIGFAQVGLRYDYVEGTESSPVGYLEGIFIKDNFRKKGFGKKLLYQCEIWARNQGCKEFGSDCELDNLDSLKFHLSSNFEESNRIICFKKNL